MPEHSTEFLGLMLRKQEETMPHYPYLIIGGGMTAAAAVQGLREVDPTGAIGLIGLDTHPLYQRPPLSKALWSGCGAASDRGAGSISTERSDWAPAGIATGVSEAACPINVFSNDGARKMSIDLDLNDHNPALGSEFLAICGVSR
jgi:hypothetical protein